MFGKTYNKRVSSLACTVLFFGFNILYFPMFVLGWQGMPRRYYDFPSEFATLHLISSLGSWILVSGLLIMIVNLVRSLVKGQNAEKNPWGGTTLEWFIPSPPPRENFEQTPVITRGPYERRDKGL
jgi:cytochrome c oxidase subunit 1